MTLLPVVHDRETAFAYACHGCGLCCHHKAIVVGPYAVARLAETLGMTTTEVLDRYVDPETSVLRQTDGGSCVFYDGGCSVHAGRPLSCRLYPLGWSAGSDGSEAFLQLSGHPDSAGVTSAGGTVAGYLAQQETAPYERASQQYAAVLRRLRAALEAEGADPGEPPSVLDVDAALADDPAASADLEARIDRHLALLHAWLDTASAPPST